MMRLTQIFENLNSGTAYSRIKFECRNVKNLMFFESNWDRFSRAFYLSFNCGYTNDHWLVHVLVQKYVSVFSSSL
jgi:hypothetical protein